MHGMRPIPAALLGTFLFLAWPAARPEGSPAGIAPPALSVPGSHHRACRSCHGIRGTDAAARESSPDGSAAPAATSGAASPRCLDCHQDLLEPAPPAGVLSDPDQVSPSRHLLPPWTTASPPLGGGSPAAVDCRSCHDPHAPGGGTRLRVKDAGAPGTARAGTEGGTPADFDPVTRLCLGCHPQAAAFDEREGHFGRHPVGVLPPVEALDRIRALGLPLADVAGTDSPDDDVIACTTCHRVHASRNPFLLRWSETRSWIACGACHREVLGPAADPATLMARDRLGPAG